MHSGASDTNTWPLFCPVCPGPLYMMLLQKASSSFCSVHVWLPPSCRPLLNVISWKRIPLSPPPYLRLLLISFPGLVRSSNNGFVSLLAALREPTSTGTPGILCPQVLTVCACVVCGTCTCSVTFVGSVDLSEECVN